MKEYRITAWAQPKPPFASTAHRRMLTDLSHRYLSVEQLAHGSSLRRHQVEQFLQSLQARGVLLERELFLQEPTMGRMAMLGEWFKRRISISLGR